MNCTEFLSSMTQRDAIIAPPATEREITLANTILQQIRAAILPKSLIDFYLECGGINLGSGYIFGPNEISRGAKYPIPSLAQANRNLSGISHLRGKTVFGRNDLFWFAFDTFGKFLMLDNITLKTLRTYQDVYQAMSDCLIAGKL